MLLGGSAAPAFWSMVAARIVTSGPNLTLGTCPFLRHARESGHPEPAPGMNRGATDSAPAALGSRLRGGDEEEKIGVVCLVRTDLRRVRRQNILHVAAIGGGVIQGYHLLHPNRTEPSAGGGV